MKRPHSAAVDSLARHLTHAGFRAYPELRRAGWQTSACGVPDMLSMKRFAYGATTWRLDAHEVKVSAADLRQDVRAGKWARYVDELGVRFIWFAIASDDALKAIGDVPAECGIVVRREDDTWHTRRTPRSLQHSLSKVDPMLLVAMMDSRPYEIAPWYQRRNRDQEVVRGAIGSTAADALALPDLRRAAHAIGLQLRGALATPAAEGVRIPEWASRIVALWAQFYDIPENELRDSIVNGHHYEHLTNDVLRGLRAVKERDRIEKLLQAAATLVHGFEGDAGGRVRDGEAVLREISELQTDKPRARRGTAA